MGNTESSAQQLPPLELVKNCDTSRFMGNWFVIGVKPTYLETTCSNAVETYTRQNGSDANHDVHVDFSYNNKEPITSSLKSLTQKGWIQGKDKENSSSWVVSPFWPLKLDYPIIELEDKNYSYCVVGQQSRSYCWILSRKPFMPDAQYNDIIKTLRDKHRYDIDGFRKVPQVWTKEERDKRGLTSKDIPDSFLTTLEDQSLN